MAGVTQTIDTYYAGISQQPDLKKFPGQVKDIVNGIPDITEGLYKRPGTKRIGSTPLANVQSNGSWFHYYRDETEGSYIGQIASDGKVRMWSCENGVEKDVWYHTDNSAYNGSNSDHTSITNYLTPSSATATEDLQTLTINDTTFLNNRTKPVLTTGTTDNYIDAHFAFIELLRTENGRQYGLNIFNTQDTTSHRKRATRLKIQSDTLYEGGGSGPCPGIGTQVFSVSDFTIGSFGANTVSATFTSSDANGLTNNKITITYANHGLKSGDQIKITGNSAAVSGGFTNQTKHQITVQDVNTFYYITTANEGDHTNQGCTIESAHKGKRNLIFRITTLGQQGQLNRIDDAESVDHSTYSCSYNRQVTLLHGGEGWETGDTVSVTLTQAKTDYTYTLRVEDHEDTFIKGTINGDNEAGIIRPAPTPFDADTAVTPDTILGSIATELSGTGVSWRLIGTGLYLYSTNAFSVEVVDQDLMRVMQKSVNNVADLPNQCRHGYIVKVANSRDSVEDDYYLKFEGNGNIDGAGSWVECPAPNIVKSLDATTMPHVLQRQTDGDFLVKKYSWEDRVVGDDNTNALPSFVSVRSGHPNYSGTNVDKYINKVLFFRNRLALLSGENVILSRPGELSTPSFFAKTALAVSAVDPIDISSSSMFPSDLFDGVETTSGLLVFSTNQQFLLSSDAEILNPDTAKLRSVSTYNYNKNIPPISLGVTVGYIDNSGKNSRFNEMANIQREGEPIIVETSKLIPTLLNKNIDLLTNSRENQLILFGKTNTDIVYGYKYLQSGDRRPQTAWFKWKFNNPLKYHFIIDDDYYILDTDDFLQRMSIMQEDTDPSIEENGVDYLIHLDNWTTVGNGTYSASTNLTTFANQSDWIDQVTTPNGSLVIIDIDSNATRVGRYAECTVTNTDDFTVPGDWSTGTFYIGYLYEYSVHFPTLYLTKQEGEQSKSDVNSSLIIHRIKLNFGKSGLYSTTLQRVGKADYTETYESSLSDEYLVSDAPYLPEQIQTVPVYEKNSNVEVLLKSSHPSPATLHAMSWEGDYSQRNYKRV